MNNVKGWTTALVTQQSVDKLFVPLSEKQICADLWPVHNLPLPFPLPPTAHPWTQLCKLALRSQ